MSFQRKVPVIVRLHHVALNKATSESVSIVLLFLTFGVQIPYAGLLVQASCENQWLIRFGNVLDGTDAIGMSVPIVDLLDSVLG